MKISAISIRAGIVGACAAGSARGSGRRDHRRAVGHGRSRPVQRQRAVRHRQLGDRLGPCVSRQPPGREPAVTTAFSQPRDQAAATLRGYFTANPHEYYDLRGILAPIGDKQSQCNVTVLPPDLASAYSEFMAG